MDTPVLLLNANYEPLAVRPTRRAVGLMLAEKAVLILNGRGIIRTISAEYPRPSIIRLTRMVHIPRPHVRFTRQEIFRRDQLTCQYCGKQGGRLTLDHVIPRRLGGSTTWTNIVTACAECNRKKGGRPLAASKMQLLRRPFEPRPSALYRFTSYANQYEDWMPYLEGW
ncbi:MAG: HNH endonuclease [Anaerolineales bacterium]|nr:HNH endonuclease [Anaerolineales bacterium]